MDLKELQKSLEEQHATKAQEINKLNQALSKAQQELLKIEGGWEVVSVQLKEVVSETAKPISEDLCACEVKSE